MLSHSQWRQELAWVCGTERTKVHPCSHEKQISKTSNKNLGMWPLQETVSEASYLFNGESCVSPVWTLISTWYFKQTLCYSNFNYSFELHSINKYYQKWAVHLQRHLCIFNSNFKIGPANDATSCPPVYIMARQVLTCAASREIANTAF